ncbi:F-box/kelch-repeat protein At1g80440 [Selaginella moellendorffii]|nr:F-box/kelch-repeat protein At1g80440 [Selaginella moellendorffii]|eukprot:XP_002965894.2 F-box/kelch-repeat protein At1g80440 [Selaginella moellendorffii]
MAPLQELIPGLPFDVALHCLVRVPHTSHPQMQRVCREWESLIASPDFYALRKKCATTRSAIVVAQAHKSPKSPEEQQPPKGALPPFGLSLYYPSSRSWERIPPIPELGDHGGIPLFSGIAAVESKLFIVGGWNPSSFQAMRSVFVFDFSRGAWSRGSDMPGAARSFFACCAVGDDSIFVAGGHDESKNALRSCDRYLVREDRWEAMPDMTQERDESRGIAIDRSSQRLGPKFGVVSGYGSDSQGEFSRSAEFLDPATGKWSRAEDLIDDSLVSHRDGTNLFVGAGDSIVYCCSRSSGEIWRLDCCDHPRNATNRCSRRVGQLPANCGKAVAACAGISGGGVVVLGQDERGVLAGFAPPDRRDRRDPVSDSKDSATTWVDVLGDGGDEFRGVVQAACAIEL